MKKMSQQQIKVPSTMCHRTSVLPLILSFFHLYYYGHVASVSIPLSINITDRILPVQLNTTILMEGAEELNITQQLNVQHFQEGRLTREENFVCSHMTTTDLATDFFQLSKLAGAYDAAGSQEQRVYSPSSTSTLAPIFPETTPATLSPDGVTLNIRTSVMDINPLTRFTKAVKDLREDITPGYDLTNGRKFGREFLRALEENGVRSRHKRDSTTDMLQMTLDVTESREKYVEIRDQCASVLGALIKSMVPSVSEHCLYHYHIKNIVNCFTSHYIRLHNEPDFPLVMALYSEYLSLTVKIHYMDEILVSTLRA
uniref:Hypothtetical protein n=1 Tax=Drosophila melanogaster sigmavirus TaxID=1094373 RepID=A0A2Z4QKK5_9RHAB|nr:hypothtetical protein [Drosophila melanogaster sigmavirus]